MGKGPLDLWNEWATQILVLLSLTLQVVLLLFAGIRRREASVVTKFILWLAYQLADSTAIYAVGHLSLSSVPVKHQLVAFWAPFLLLHLGGPDNITAYALEDSKLWLRHLQNLIVQVLGVAYVLYKYVVGGDFFVLLAAILMFTVGVFKYGERTWALWRSNLDSIRSSLQTEHVGYHQHFHPPNYRSTMSAVEGDEFYVRRAHSMFHISKLAVVDSWVVRPAEKEQENENSGEEKEDPDNPSWVVDMDIKKELSNYKSMWTLTEMGLSLIYDLLYTKAGIIHTWCGYVLRVTSSLAAAASFLLFQFSSKDDHNRVDVAVSYTLLAGAFLLETSSLLRALGSSWAYAFLCNTRWSWLRYAALCSGRWDRLRWIVKAITEKGGDDNISVRRWSGKIRQYNMLHVCSDRSRSNRPLVGIIASMLGYEDWWIRYHYSWSVEFSEYLKERLFVYTNDLTKRKKLNMQGVIRKNWGKQAFQNKGEVEFYDSLKERDNNYLGAEFQEGIIIWHIATDVFISQIGKQDTRDAVDLVKAIRMLSNYMIYLLVDRPYMLPGLAHSMLYRLTRDNLTNERERSPGGKMKGTWKKLKQFFSLQDDPDFDRLMHVDDLADILAKTKPQLNLGAPRLYFSYIVNLMLLDRMKEKGRTAMFMLELLLEVWMDFLVYAANRCSRESHAKKLSNGGELTTILWLMTYYLHLNANNAAQKKRGG
ncbi:unnamed protein product [Urochloa humidicola]